MTSHLHKPLRLCLLVLALAGAAPAVAEEAWHAWLDCTFDDWPITAPGETDGFEIGDRAALIGLWQSVGGLPLPQVLPDPSGRTGRSILLTRGVGVPALSAARAGKPGEGKIEIRYSVYFRSGICTTLHMTAVDPGNGRRDASVAVGSGDGLVQFAAAGKSQDTEYRVLPDRWTRFRLLLDLDVGTYSVYAGDEPSRIAGDISFPRNYRPSVFLFGCSGAAGQGWIDDVSVRVTKPTSTPSSAPGPPKIVKSESPAADTALPNLFDASNERFPVPSLDELQSGLSRWAEARKGMLTVREVGRSRKGHPIHLCIVTKKAASGQDKQRVLVTTSRGRERNATVLALALLRWLLSDDPRAVETRRKQEIHVMPCSDPDGYESATNSQDFVDHLTWTGPRDPKRFPAGAALMSAIAEIQPEVHVDVRSIDDARNVLAPETFGVDFDSAIARSCVHRIPYLMNLAAEKAGFSCLAGEVGDGKIRATGPVGALVDHHYYQRNRKITVPSLSYYNCHALSFTAHMACQESFLAGMKELFAAGGRDRPWRMERYPGYPVNRFNIVLTGGMGSWGRTAEERRRSRCELWNKMEQITLAEPGYGIIGGRALVFSSDAAQMRRLASKGLSVGGGIHLVRWDGFLDALRREPDAARFQIDEMDRMVCAKHRADVGMFIAAGVTAGAPGEAAVRHGLALQLYTPFPDAKITEIRLDGHPIAESGSDGYSVYHNPGTAVEVTIPPGRVRSLHIVTLLYDGGIERRYGFSKEDWAIK